MKNKKRIAAVAAACALLAGIFVGGAVAYLTDADTAVNTFTVGRIRIDTLEPNFAGNGSDEVTDQVPMQETVKDPLIKNTGKNRAIVYMQVDIPMADVVTADEEGNRQPQANQELFQFRTKDGEYNSTGDGWILLEETYLDGDMTVLDTDSILSGMEKLGRPDGFSNDEEYRAYLEKYGNKVPEVATSGEIKDVARYTRRLYGYADVLKENSYTNSIFDFVRLINVVEGYIDGSTQNIVITTFALQADNISGLTDASAGDGMTEETLRSIFRTYVKQSGSISPDEADHTGLETLRESTLNVTMSVDDTHLTLGTGNDDDAAATAKVTVAYVGPNTKPDYTLTSSDESVVTVDHDGNIRAVGEGEAVITATAVNPDSGKEAVAKVTIRVAVRNKAE